ncbi:MAG: septal ring lytic transglycosylase RlpA family protein [Pseudomonadales bacterium]|nr:septal ring lytic transglycosylase RlpA family protein [Pseudomonadales bacterium]
MPVRWRVRQLAGRFPCGAALVAVVVGGCATAPTPASVEPEPKVVASDPVIIKDSAPAAPPPSLANLPDPVVRNDPKSRRGNNPYVVFGKHYQVMDSAAGYDQVGRASWYGTKFHGRTTSSGEPYDMYELTAAHRSLPIPTYARVTNLHNGKSSIVRINDRGPFHPERIIDLSYAAAVKLGFERTGTARVRVESLAATSAADERRASRVARFFVDTGIYANASSARGARDEVTALTSRNAFVVRVEDTFAVRIGPFATFEAAERLQSLLVFADRPRPVILTETAYPPWSRGVSPVAHSATATP